MKLLVHPDRLGNMMFVFGSNTAGIHGAGAARWAYENRAAEWGKGIGPSGCAYAIPTKGHIKKGIRLRVGDTLPLQEIKDYVLSFLILAKHAPHIEFQVTCIGCGLAGLKHEDIAPMFRQLGYDVLPNLFFDELWKPYLSPEANFWGTF